jgi:peptidyl-prolyl cis-trans isomerase SurA
MKKIIEIFLSILVLIYASPYSMANSDYEELDSIIAIVENDVITNKELQKALSELKKNPRNKNKEVNQTKLRRLALDQLIERKIIIQYAEAQSINIESALIENALKNIASNNKVSVEDLKKNAHKEGSLEKLYSEIRFQLILRAIKERAIFSQIHISDYEIEKFLEKEKVSNPDQYKISHILIKIEGETQREAAEKKIKEVQMLLNEETFNQVAKKYSNGPFAKNGGEMGWLSFSDLPDLFVDKIIKLKKNEVSFPFESKNGLHIIKLDDIKSFKKNKVYSSQYNINQILIKQSQITSEDDILKKMDNIKNKIIDGLPFEDAAAQYSEDSTSSLKGGALGWVDRNNLLPEFQVELDKGKLNNLIGPFKTSAGWHLIKLIGKREKDITEDSRKLAAKLKILNYKAEIRYKDWFEILKQSSNIEMINN